VKIRKRPCEHCPTAHYPPDPGALQTREWVRSGEMPAEEMLFVCGWSPTRVCRGVYEEMVALKAEIAREATGPAPRSNRKSRAQLPGRAAR
jgi:hypothetical protein